MPLSEVLPAQRTPCCPSKDGLEKMNLRRLGIWIWGLSAGLAVAWYIESVFDIIDYPFQVSNGRASCTVRVGITGAYHDPAEALGSKKLSQDERVEAARAWLRSRVEKGECDPFSRPETDTIIDVPSGVMDHWAEHREIPHWV